MKKTKAKKMAKIGKCDHTFNLLWDKIPEQVIARNTADTLAWMVDMMYDQHQSGIMIDAE